MIDPGFLEREAALARYISLYSGSSGNCSVVEEDGKYLMIDIGKSARQTIDAMKELGLDSDELLGILISHEHIDHVRGLRVFLKRNRAPVFTNPYTLEKLEDEDHLPGDAMVFEMGEEAVEVGPFKVEGFYVPHDSRACMGYRITTKSGSVMSIATDIGFVSENTYSWLSGADLVVLESNYDELMLKNGPYPANLKFRVASKHGHLSNTECSRTVLRLVEEGTMNIHLCHLSENNNTPRTALMEVVNMARKNGVVLPEELNLKINRRHEITPPTEF